MIANASLCLPATFPYPCTAAYGRDRFGVWQTVVVAGVAQMFRWVPPGRFLMGSPAEEVDRDGDELQREVRLTRGFWLADTACTQALWIALVDHNPSECQGNARPVEQVSFARVGAFLHCWRLLCPEFAVRLPSEAEWEYACRAGTTTAFSFGETILTDQANYDDDFLYPVIGAKSQTRRETVPVKTLPANPWGLYEMHGNVNDWCADRYGAYDVEDRVDPTGLAVGTMRFMRGRGFWHGAGICRAARRLGVIRAVVGGFGASGSPPILNPMNTAKAPAAAYLGCEWLKRLCQA